MFFYFKYLIEITAPLILFDIIIEIQLVVFRKN